MNNNDIFKKLRVALQLRDDQIEEILKLVDFRMSKGEIGNFFRSPEHPKYVECGDQVLRNFLNGLVIHLRGTKEAPRVPRDVIASHKSQPAAATLRPKPNVDKKPAQQSKPKAKTFAAKKSPVENVRFKNGKSQKRP